MSATSPAYDEESDGEWSTRAVDRSERAHSVSSSSGSMGALSCTTQNSKATVPTTPPAPQKDIDTAIPLAILMHSAQCHNNHAGLPAGDAPPKEPMHKAQHDEIEEDTVISLTNPIAEGHYNENESTAGDSPVLNQRTSFSNLRVNSLAPLTALGSLFTPIRSLPTFLTGAKLMNPLKKCALPFWKKSEQLQSQQQVQVAGREQAVSSSGVVDDEEQLGSPPPPLPAPHTDPDHGHASESAQSVASPTTEYPGSRRSNTPGTDAVPALSSSPMSGESSKSDTTPRPDEPADDPAQDASTATVHTAQHDVEMDSEESPPEPPTAWADRLPPPPASLSGLNPPQPEADFALPSSAHRSAAPSPSPSLDREQDADAPSSPTPTPLTAQPHNDHTPATTAAGAEEPPLSPPQPKRKRAAEQTQGQAPPAQILSGLERFRAHKRAKRVRREDTAELQRVEEEEEAGELLRLRVRVPAGLRRGGGRTRGLKGEVWGEYWEEKNGGGEI